MINYQTNDRDLYETFHTVSTHLKSGGILIFDFWYGPAVLSNKPMDKQKEIEDEELKITRTSKSVMYPERDLVDVKVEVEIINKLSGEKINLSESHKMRYLFLSKLQQLLSEFRIEIIKEEEWLTGKPLGRDSWNACIIARAT